MICKMEGLSLRAVSSHIPEKEIPIDSYVDFFGEKKVKRLKRSTGVEFVHVVSPEETASDLCVKAAENLFEKEKISRDSIDGIVFVSISPDYRAPGTAGILQDRLGLSEDVVAVDLTFGCSGYIYGLYEAGMLIKAGGCKRVLLCAGDTQSLLVNENDRSMKMLVGDAGTVSIIEAGQDSWEFYFKTVGSGFQNLIIPAGGCRHPSTEATRKERVDADGNVRRDVDLYMNGGEVMKFALSEVPVAVDTLCEEVGVEKEQINLFAFHQPNKLILDYLKNLIGIPDEKAPVGLRHVGNTASASIPVLLTTLAANGYDYSSAKDVIACGFGIGLSIGATHVNLSDTQFYSE